MHALVHWCAWIFAEIPWWAWLGFAMYLHFHRRTDGLRQRIAALELKAHNLQIDARARAFSSSRQ